MNNSTDQSLAEVFGTYSIEETTPVVVANTEPQQFQVINVEDEKEADIQHVRANLYDLIKKGTTAADNALKVANEMQHPRAYEVAGNLIKNVGDLTDKLVQLQKTLVDMDAKEKKATTQNVNVNNAALFVGTTAELLKAIKNNVNTSANNPEEIK
jgi:Terminase DNA packaging enzyme